MRVKYILLSSLFCFYAIRAEHFSRVKIRNSKHFLEKCFSALEYCRKRKELKKVGFPTKYNTRTKKRYTRFVTQLKKPKNFDYRPYNNLLEKMIKVIKIEKKDRRIFFSTATAILQDMNK